MAGYVGLVETAIAAARADRRRLLDELTELVAIRSVSTDPSQAAEVERAARRLMELLDAAGAGESRLIATPVHPIVWAEFPAGEPGSPTLLLYGHYDVQPPDPLDEWESEPFGLVERDGRLYGRGASDMKAQVLACIAAVRAAKAAGPLPVNLRFLLEGEEEIGSPSLAEAITTNAGLFGADVCLNTDAGMIAPDIPSIRYGLRGLAYFELRLTGPARDLHSGSFGGVVHNPAQVLAELIAGMHRSDGSVALPGFYDRVRPVDGSERERARRVPVTDADLLRHSGAPALWGERGYSAVERIGARPTLEVNGVWGGYSGAGSKTIIPASAGAKLSTRLVPDQDYREVRGQLESYLREHAPPTVRWELTELAGGAPFICDPDSPAHRAFAEALRDVWGSDPILSREGGSVPVAAALEELLGVPSILSGFGLPDDRIHSPNESQHVETWFRGIDAVIRFLYRFGEPA